MFVSESVTGHLPPRRRTAVGKFGGSLAGVPAFALGATVIKQLLEAPEVSSDQKPGWLGYKGDLYYPVI